MPKPRWRKYVATILLLVLYPLSMGPADVLAVRVDNAAVYEVSRIIYWPIVNFANVTNMNRPFLKYLHWWYRITNTPWGGYRPKGPI